MCLILFVIIVQIFPKIFNIKFIELKKKKKVFINYLEYF